MMFDVMLLLKEKNAVGKERRNVYRVHNKNLNKFVKDAQDRGDYIEQVNPLFRQKLQEVIKRHIEEKLTVEDPIDSRAMIDPHGF